MSAAFFFGYAAVPFERRGALRLARGARTNVAAMYLEMGANQLALEALDRASVAAERVGARYTLTLARLNRGIALGRLGQLTLAVRAELPVELLRDTIQPYPTFSEAIQFALRDLPI